MADGYQMSRACELANDDLKDILRNTTLNDMAVAVDVKNMHPKHVRVRVAMDHIVAAQALLQAEWKFHNEKWNDGIYAE